MIKVISLKTCPFVQRVTATLEAKKTPYALEYISLKEPPSWFAKISPNAQVPLLITESGVALCESEAIVEYLDEVFGPLQSDLTAEQRAINRAWGYRASNIYLAQCSAMQSADEPMLIERTKKLEKTFATVENTLNNRPYFLADSLGRVDIAWLPLLHRATIIERYTHYDFLKNYPKMKAWQATLMGTGLAEKSVSADFEKKFTELYLSDNTFLGKGQNCANVAKQCC